MKAKKPTMVSTDHEIRSLEFNHPVFSDIYEVDPRDLIPHPDNESLFHKFKKTLDTAGLSDSVRRHGILEPVLLCNDGKTIISGHSRTSIATVLGLRTIKARRLTSKHTNEEILEMLVTLNVSRFSMTKPERLDLYNRIYPGFTDRLLLPGSNGSKGGANPGLNETLIAKKTGIAVETVRADLHAIRKHVKNQRHMQSIHSQYKTQNVDFAAVNAVKGYGRKILEHLEYANPQTGAAIMDAFAKASAKIMTASAKRR